MNTTVRVPVWLLDREPPSCHKVVTRGRYGEGFVHRTLGDLTSTRRSILSALPAKAGHGWLEMVDARVKVLGALLLLIVAGMARNHTVLLVLCVLAVSGAVTSGLPALSILRRALLPALFAAILVLPAALTWLRPGHPILVLCQFQEEIRDRPVVFAPTPRRHRGGNPLYLTARTPRFSLRGPGRGGGFRHRLAAVALCFAGVGPAESLFWPRSRWASVI